MDGGDAAGGGDGNEAGAAACVDPEVLIQPGPAGRASGFETCGDGFIHRAQAVQCDPGGFGEGDCDNPWGSSGECMSDDECAGPDGSAGVCLDSGEPGSGCSCSFGCGSDDDCDSGESCYCNGSRSVCITASCRTDADCDEGELCGLSELVGACGTVRRSLTCTGPADECRVDADCDECLQCLRGADDGGRTCSGSTGVCGPCG